MSLDSKPELQKSQKLQDVCYDIRGPVLHEANRMEEEGQHLMKLNIGNPAPFQFEAPQEILADVIHNLPDSTGYCHSKGLFPARKAVMQYYQTRGLPDVGVDDIFIGNGVSELIVMAMQALLNDGDEVLIPAPDYPLWTASVNLSGGTPVHYLCDEEQDWQPDIDDIRSRIISRTRALVVINPNNPTGAVYSAAKLEALAQVARENNLVLLGDEIYDKITYDDAEHHCLATFAEDLICITFNGLSKSYRIAGFRTGWMVITGAKDGASDFLEGLNILTSMRLCANVPGQHAVQTALGGYQSIEDLVLPTGRLGQQRDLAWRMLNDIPGVSCAKPRGALYLFPHLDPEMYPIADDEAFVLDLLREEKVLVVHGSAFNWPDTQHFRIVFLPQLEDLRKAIERIARYLERIRQ